MKNKFKAILKRGKALIAAAAIAVTSAMTAAVACAETAEETTTATGSEMSTVLADAGEQITSSFNDLVATIVPVLLGILLSGLTVFGIIALVKLAKKIFGKVAG